MFKHQLDQPINAVMINLLPGRFAGQISIQLQGISRHGAHSGHSTTSKNRNGFTLLELVITLCVAAIALSFAAPSFQSMMQDSKQVDTYNKLSGALRYARAEATKRSDSVSVCARATDTSCGSDWGKGWLVFTDSTETGGTELTLDNTDTVLKFHRLETNGLSVAATAIVRPTGLAAQSNILFTSRGRSSWDIGTFVVCDGRGAVHAKAMAVNGGGLLRRLTTNTNSAPPDAQGNPVTCP